MYGADYGLWCACRSTDGALEVTDVGACKQCAACGVCVSRDCEEVGDCAKVGLLERRDEAVIPRNARSTPAENAFSRAEETTMTRTVGSSAIRSNAAPYSRQYLFSCNRVVSTKDLASEKRSAASTTPSGGRLLSVHGVYAWPVVGWHSHQDQWLVW